MIYMTRAILVLYIYELGYMTHVTVALYLSDIYDACYFSSLFT